MSEFKGIPVVSPAVPTDTDAARRSGQKYVTPQGFTAIRDGIKAAASTAPVTPVGRKPGWLRAPMPAGAGFEAVKHTVREQRLATVC